MNPREKRLIKVAGILLGVLLLGALTWGFFIAPWRQVQDARRSSQATLAQLRQEQAELSKAMAAFAALRDRTFADDVEIAKPAVETWIKEAAHQAGLTPDQLSLSTFSDEPVGGDRELVVTVSSPHPAALPKLVNLLYLLARSGHLATISSLSIHPQGDFSEVSFSLRYATLVPAEKPTVPVPARQAASQVAAVDVAEVTHEPYAAIAGRNMFLPYVPPVRREPPKSAPVAASAPAPEITEQMVLAALPSTSAGPEVHLADTASGAVRVLKIGQRVLGSDIVAVDYRELPMPGNPAVSSYSRVILRSGTSYYAVELGQKLADRRVIQLSDLPPSLRFILEGQ